MELAVMYKDLSIVRVDFDSVDTLVKSEVLFIIASEIDAVNPRLNGKRRVAEIHGWNHYLFLRRRDNFLLTGWDDGMWEWHREDTPFARDALTPLTQPPVTRYMGVTFEGPDTELDSAGWQVALAKFQAEMH